MLKAERNTDNGPKDGAIAGSAVPSIIQRAAMVRPNTSNSERREDEHDLWEDERRADDGPFQERFLLHEVIFAHCKFLPRPTIQVNLMSRADWCALRGLRAANVPFFSITEIAAS